MSGTPWSGLMAAAVRLGLSPEAFWRVSVREWRLIVGGAGGAGMGRHELERLAMMFPDEEAGHGGGR
jgi:uncharacterized phage protein (TIGR02216 family)